MELSDTLRNEIDFVVNDLAALVPNTAEAGESYVGGIPLSEELIDLIDQNEVKILDQTILPRIQELLGPRAFSLTLTRTYMEAPVQQVLCLGTVDADGW
jgi:hypothetical protein